MPDAEEGEAHALAHDETLHPGGRGAECEAHAELLGALGDGVRHDAVEADGGEGGGEAGEDGEQHHGEAARSGAGGDELVHGGDVGDGDIGVDGLERGANAGHGAETGSPLVRTAKTMLRLPFCRSGKYACSRRSPSSPSCMVWPTTPTIWIQVMTESRGPLKVMRFPIGSSFGQEAAHHLLVDDGHERRVRVVLLGELPSLDQRRTDGREVTRG